MTSPLEPILAPRRELLVDQVTAALRREIATGRWREWLPAERTLIRVFNVSRGTLRTGLHRLVVARELVIRSKQGYRICARPDRVASTAASALPQVALISPERIYSMPSYVVQVVDLLRSMAAEAGMHLDILEGARFERTDPGRYMPALLRSHPGSCWVPIMANRRLQEWFVSSQAPAVIYGNVFPDLPLAAVGVDYRAVIRHATSLLLARGHRRIALVLRDPTHAGDQESLDGFHAAFRAHPGEDVLPLEMARPDDDVAAFRRQVDRTMALRRPPTAFIVCRTHHYAMVATRLLETGWKIPGDVSLICRGEDVSLRFLCPSPSFYRVNVELLARTLFRGILRTVGGAMQTGEQHRLVPDFIAGASLGKPSAA